MVSIAILLAFGNVAFAAEKITINKETAKIAVLQVDKHEKPPVLNEISVGESSQVISQNEYLGLGFIGIFNSSQHFSYSTEVSKYNASYSLKDKRKLIFRHLFPFHFFW
ncbi:hypothetical protein [Aequorivita sp. Q41]|uniref:hypothetical protein n=1 Tax=Aequorivita sp. Q41 TaxID=3153300 RepID=UPI0032428A25